MITIDSTKIRIPFGKVQVLNPELGEKTSLVSNRTGEVIKEMKTNSLKIEENGISTYYGIEKQVDSDRRTYSYLVILFNSKLLKGEYLNGIWKDNIKLIYDALIGHRVVYFSYDDFMNGYVTDVDFKKDITTEYFDKILIEVNKYTKPSKMKNRGTRVYNRVGHNRGIDFGERKTATPSYPFLKIYDKETELRNNSTEFYQSNNIQIPSNLIRIEFTIKNRKHFRRYEIEENTLNSVLNLEGGKLYSILKDIFSIHLEPRKPKAPVMKNLSPTDLIICNSIYFMLEGGVSIGNIVDSLTDNIESKVARSRTKRKLNDLYRYHIKDQKVDIINKEVNGFFESIGWV